MARDGRRSSLYDGDADDSPRSGVIAAVIAVLAVALIAAGIGIAVVVARDDGDRAADAGAVPETVPDPTADGPSSGLVDRVTAEGLTIRLRVGDNLPGMGPVVAPANAPAWCASSGMAMGTVISEDAVAQTQMPVGEVSSPGGGGQLMVGGTIEAAPIWGVLVQVPPTVVTVRATLPGMEPDEMQPVDGLAIVALPAPVVQRAAPGFNPWGDIDLTGAKIEYVSVNGHHQQLDAQTAFMGPPMWNDPKCFQQGVDPGFEPPPPTVPELPPPGDQPHDPAAEQAAVTATLVELFRAPVEEGREFFELIDDASGIDLSVAEHLATRPDLKDVLSDSDVEIAALVFVSPVEAFFYYDIDEPNGKIINRFGRARVVDGRWKVTRGTFCQEVSAYGVFCGV